MGEHPPKPFPQFEDDVFESPRTFVGAIRAWDAIHEADRPHIVLVYDPETDSYSAHGPYATGYLANERVVADEAELNSEQNNDGPKFVIRVVPFTEVTE